MDFKENGLASWIVNLLGGKGKEIAAIKVEVEIRQGKAQEIDRVYPLEVRLESTIDDILTQIRKIDDLKTSQPKLGFDENTNFSLRFGQSKVDSKPAFKPVTVTSAGVVKSEQRNVAPPRNALFRKPTLNQVGLDTLKSSVHSIQITQEQQVSVINAKGLPQVFVSRALLDKLNYILWRSGVPLKVRIVSVYNAVQCTVSLLDMYTVLESGSHEPHNLAAEAYRTRETVRLRNRAKLKYEEPLAQNSTLSLIEFSGVVAQENSVHDVQLAGEFGDFDLYLKYSQSGLQLAIARYGVVGSEPYTEVCYGIEESRKWDWDIRELEFLFSEHVHNWRARSGTEQVLRGYLDFSRRDVMSSRAVAPKEWAQGIVQAAKGMHYSWKGTERTSVRSLVTSAGMSPRLADFRVPFFEITRKALDKIRYLCWRNLKEIGWSLICTVSSTTGAIKVVDICVPPQSVTSVTFVVGNGSPSSLNRQSYIENPDCQIAYWLIAHSHVNFPTDPSGVDLNMFWEYMEDHQNWTFIVNRQGDLRLMFGDAAVSRNHFVEYVPWTIDEGIRWDWDVTALEKVMKESVENWEAASGTEVVVQEALRLAANENRSSVAPVTSITLEPETSKTEIQPAVIQEAAVLETAASSEPKLTNAQILERIAVHKVTFDPAFQRTKNDKGYFIPDDPDFIVIEGYGKVTREEMMSDWVKLSRDQVLQLGLRNTPLISAPNGFVIVYRLLPENWKFHFLD
jgi:hypothetical protein